MNAHNELRTSNLASRLAKNPNKSLDERRLEFISNMSADDVMAICREHSNKFGIIHESIEAQWLMNPSTLTDTQLATMQTFLVQNAPEITGELEDEQPATASADAAV
jgi:hypothetical protein